MKVPPGLIEPMSYQGLDGGISTCFVGFLIVVACGYLDFKEVLVPKRANDLVFPFCMFEMLAKWFLLTRLETRTKESNIYASIWVVNPDA